MNDLEYMTRGVHTIEIKGGRSVTVLGSERSLDLVGDEMEKGVYEPWLGEWKSGRAGVVPLVDTHDYSSILKTFGWMTDARVVDNGLVNTFAFIPDDTIAEAAFKRAQLGVINAVSIGYTPKRWRAPNAEEKARGVRRVLQEIAIHEISLVQHPAQPRARVLRVEGGKVAPAALDRREAVRRFDLACGIVTPPATDRRMSREDQAELRQCIAALQARGPVSELTQRALLQNLKRVREAGLRSQIAHLLGRAA